MRPSFTAIFIAIILIVALIAGVVLVRRQQQLQGEAAGIPTPVPTFSFEPTPLPANGSLVGDFDGNGVINNLDYTIFLQKYENKDPAVDLDKSGQVDPLDLNLFLSKMVE